MLKKYIDEHTVLDVPRNGIITVEIENEKGERVEVSTGVSNLPLAFEKDISLANRNGYYEYTEGAMPLTNDGEEFLIPHYVLEDNTIIKVWSAEQTEAEK